MVETSIVIRILTYVAGFIAILISLLVMVKCLGRLRRAILYLTLAILLFVIKKAFVLLIVKEKLVEIADLWIDFGIVLLLLLSVYSMKKMIYLINNRIRSGNGEGFTRKPDIKTYN